MFEVVHSWFYIFLRLSISDDFHHQCYGDSYTSVSVGYGDSDMPVLVCQEWQSETDMAVINMQTRDIEPMLT